jgi:hypothetical protein
MMIRIRLELDGQWVSVPGCLLLEYEILLFNSTVCADELPLPRPVAWSIEA